MTDREELAAARLDTKRAVDELFDKMGIAADGLDALLAENARLREALAPFAEAAMSADAAWVERSPSCKILVSLAACRSASAALAPPEPRDD